MGTSKNLPHSELSMTNIIYCVAIPCNTSSITAVCRLVTDICQIRNSARVPFFREPLNLLECYLLPITLGSILFSQDYHKYHNFPVAIFEKVCYNFISP